MYIIHVVSIRFNSIYLFYIQYAKYRLWNIVVLPLKFLDILHVVIYVINYTRIITK